MEENMQTENLLLRNESRIRVVLNLCIRNQTGMEWIMIIE